MGLKSYFDRDLRTSVIFAIAGIIIGYVSFLMNNSLLSLVIAIVVAGALKAVMQRGLQIKEDMKWWLGSGIVLYIFMWFVFWTIFYNLAIV